MIDEISIFIQSEESTSGSTESHETTEGGESDDQDKDEKSDKSKDQSKKDKKEDSDEETQSESSKTVNKYSLSSQSEVKGSPEDRSKSECPKTCHKSKTYFIRDY